MEAEGGKSGKGKTPAKRLVLFSIFFFLTFSQVHPNWAKPRLVFDKFFIK